MDSHHAMGLSLSLAAGFSTVSATMLAIFAPESGAWLITPLPALGVLAIRHWESGADGDVEADDRDEDVAVTDGGRAQLDDVSGRARYLCAGCGGAFHDARDAQECCQPGAAA